MTPLSFLVPASFFLAAQALFAQAAQPSLPPAGQSSSGISVVAELNKDLSSTKLKSSDRVSARVIQDAIVNGKILIPRDSKLVGHIVDSTKLGDSARESQVKLVFDGAQLKHGGALELRGVIIALGPPLPDALGGELSSSSPYSPGQTGHPVTGPAGQSNAPSPIIVRPRDAGARSIQERERALDNANAQKPASAGTSRKGALSASSHGVFGLPGISLGHSGDTSIILGINKNVDIKSGSQIVISLDLTQIPGSSPR